MLNGGAFSWKSFKEATTADSTTEAEYIAASEAAKEAVWVRSFLSGLDVLPPTSSPVSLRCDNTGAIALTKEPRFHNRTKHVERKYHIIREMVDKGLVEISYISTHDNLADPLTKALPQPKHEEHVKNMGIDWNTNWD